MSTHDPLECRRALREIGEIAAVAVLQDSRMTEQEALQTIAAIADWVDEEPGGDPAACGKVIHRLHGMTCGVDFDALGDRAATNLFAEVRLALGTQNTRPGSDLETGTPA